MNSRRAFVILGSFYFFVLLVSYLLGFLYPFFTPYGWLLIPVVANFFVGYLVKEVDTAIKIIITCLSLNTGIVFGWLFFSSIDDAFLSIPLLASHYTLHAVLGVAVSSIGTAVREYRDDVIAVSVRLVKKIKQIIEKRPSKV
jgi:hypothetical protein